MPAGYGYYSNPGNSGGGNYGNGFLSGNNNTWMVPNNPNPPSPGPYAYGLQDQFNVQPNTGGVGIGGHFYNQSSSDPDVMAATNIQNEEVDARLGLNHGVNFGADDAALQMYEGRIGAKNQIGGQIAQNPFLKGQAIASDQATADTALGQGINKTNANYNSRGLLFSGQREAGDQTVRGNVASSLASSLAGTQQDYGQQLAASQNAYAQVDLGGAAQALTMSQNAVTTATQNNIARTQAMQQLGAGVGAAAGQVAGSNSAPGGNPASYINPAAGWDPSGSSGINTPYNGGGQFGGYLSDPSYSSALGNYQFGSQ